MLRLDLTLAIMLTTCPGVMAQPWFTDVTDSSGLNFLHSNGATGRYYFVETATGGGGFIDFDADGDLDIYLLNGGTINSAVDSVGSNNSGNVLYENRDGHLVNVSESSKTADQGYGMGMCIGDYDGDGLIDLFITNVGSDRLYRNLGDGSFDEVSAIAGIDDSRWSTGCSFGDIDRDGNLDLFVARYVRFSANATDPQCGESRTGPAYCAPSFYPGTPDSLYINQGNGTFRDEAMQRGIKQGASERGFGTLLSDFDNDGDLDIFVANDGTPNRLYENENGHFQDRGLLSGVAVGENGRGLAGMGVDAADYDGDGLIDIGVTNFSLEPHTLHQGRKDGLFADVSRAVGIARPTHLMVGWGIQFADFDNDADLDLAIVNGHVQSRINMIEPRLTYAQPNQVFENTGNGILKERNESQIFSSAAAAVSRGLAAGDWNNDGRVDLLITNVNARPQLLQNQTDATAKWLGINLAGKSNNRQAIGARVDLAAGEKRAWREVRSGGSYLSQADLRPLFGLGQHEGRVKVTVRWPDGVISNHSTELVNRYWTLSYPTRDLR